MLTLDAWWDGPAYKTCKIFHLCGLFMFDKLKRHDATKFAELLGDLYPDDVPDPQDIGEFGWQTILAYMGANDEEVADAQKRIGRVWRAV